MPNLPKGGISWARERVKKNPGVVPGWGRKLEVQIFF